MKANSLLPAILFLAILGSCNDRGINSASYYTGELGQMRISFSNAPAEITTVIATLSRSGHDDRTLSLTVSDSSASGTFSDVPIGTWHLVVEALDQDSVVRYRGETNVQVQPGTTIVSLELSPTSGNLEIHVTWGTTPSESLIVNGSFELGPGGGWTYWPLNPGSTAMPGWIVTRGGIDIVQIWQHHHGGRSLDLDGTPGRGGVTQSFSTIPGAIYRVQFSMAGNPEGSPTVKTMGVSAGNQATQFTFDVTGKSFQNMGWEAKMWNFTAVDSTSTLEFFSLDPSIGLYGPALDRVSVHRIP